MSLLLKRILVVSAILLLLSAGFIYYWLETNSQITRYEAQKAQEVNLQSQIQALESQNNSLRETIEQTGKTLISFTEDRIAYINLASELSTEYDVHINKLVVSDIWKQGNISGMTTDIEIEGSLDNVQSFVSQYCDVRYTNRINVVSIRPIDRYPWLVRTIDGDKVLTWFDLSTEDSIWADYIKDELQSYNQAMTEAGVTAEVPDELDTSDEEDPITVERMFSDRVFKAYLKIDFLGRE